MALHNSPPNKVSLTAHLPTACSPGGPLFPTWVLSPNLQASPGGPLLLTWVLNPNLQVSPGGPLLLTWVINPYLQSQPWRPSPPHMGPKPLFANNPQTPAYDLGPLRTTAGSSRNQALPRFLNQPPDSCIRPRTPTHDRRLLMQSGPTQVPKPARKLLGASPDASIRTSEKSLQTFDF
eukprot:361005-Chlamydomonas_euryale.AAC.3